MNTEPTLTETGARIFIAATPAEWLPMRVLEFSIREISSIPVEVSPIYSFERSIPVPEALENRPRTPFSFQRFLIPELCGFSGKAIYLDADMQVFQNITGLWDRPFSGSDLQTVEKAEGSRRPQFSVMLLDCSKLNWKIEEIVADLDANRLNYASLMFEMRVAKNIAWTIPDTWNSLEHYEPGETALLHYTDMNTQPWVSIKNKNANLWVSCLRRAVNSGFISRSDIEREIEAGNARPSLLYQIENGLDDPRALPARQLLRDVKFIPPYNRILKTRRPILYVYARQLLSMLMLSGRRLLGKP